MDSKPIQHHTVTKQFKLAVDALKEEKKFLSYLDSTEWSSMMNLTRNNLLFTTMMDQDICMNQGNEGQILESLRSSLRRLDSVLLQRRELAINETKCMNSESDNGR